MHKFSIVLPTFTGQETIANTFQSILAQSNKNFEIIVVVDGPNNALLKTVNKYQKIFTTKQVDMQVIKFTKNKGRFDARLAGARAAKGAYLLFIDDRVTLNQGYFDILENTSEEVMLPRVEQSGAKNGISRTIQLVREGAYGSNSQPNESYYIDDNNFEHSQKGTAGLWIRRKLFIEVCKTLTHKNNKHISDDTLILSTVVKGNTRIFHNHKLGIIYYPREGLKQEIKHLYGRGPKFVDYYLSPGKRYFGHLLLMIAISFFIIILSIIKISIVPILVVSLIPLAFLLSIYLKIYGKDGAMFTLFLPVTLIIFLLGLYYGLVVKSLRLIPMFKKVQNYVQKNLGSIFAVMFLAFLISYLFLNKSILEPLLKITPIFLLSIGLAYTAQIVVNGLFTKVTLAAFDKKMSLKESSYVSLITSLGNYFGPLMGGLGVRGAYLKKKHSFPIAHFLGTLYGYYLITFFTTGVIGLTSLGLIYLKNGSLSLIATGVFLGIVVATGALFFIKVPRITNKDNRFFKSKLYINLLKVSEGWEKLAGSKSLMKNLIALGVVAYFVGLATFKLEFMALDISISTPGLLLYSALGSVSLLLSLTPGAIGIRESLFLFTSNVLGLSSGEIFQLAAIDRGINILVLVVGYIYIRQVSKSGLS
jgi:glycosyltransferase involved in cell wall biosynthesis